MLTLFPQNPRYLEIAGVLLAGVAFFFIGPPKFISEPYVLPQSYTYIPRMEGAPDF